MAFNAKIIDTSFKSYLRKIEVEKGKSKMKVSRGLRKAIIALRSGAKKIARGGAGGVFTSKSTGALSRSLGYFHPPGSLNAALTVGVVYGNIQNVGGMIPRHFIKPRFKKTLAWGGPRGGPHLFFSPKGHNIGPTKIKGTHYGMKAYEAQKPLIDKLLADALIDSVTP